MSNEIDLAQLDKLPTYDPERDTPGMTELRSEFNDGDYFKVEDVRALARRASATPSSKDAEGEPVAMVTGSDTVIGRESRGLQWVKGFSAFTLEPGTKLYAVPVHAAAAPSAALESAERVIANLKGYIADLEAKLSAGAAAKTEKAPCSTCGGRGELCGVGAWYQCDDCKGSGKASAAGAGSEQVIKTWQERYNEMGVGPSFNDKSVAMMAEIDDLRAALARAPLPAQGENVDAANAGELDLDDLDNTAKEALRDLSHVENHLEQSDAPTKVKNRAVDVRLCIKELRAALNDRAGAQDGQAVDDARDAARYRWLRENCYDYEPAGEGDAFDHPSLHFESSELDPYDSASLNWAVDAAMSASRPDDKGGD